ncbi:MAG: response regulator [Planctomycetota bacterium]|nr:MAG: response regulator [Planctomycetota bacterium]
MRDFCLALALPMLKVDRVIIDTVAMRPPLVPSMSRSPNWRWYPFSGALILGALASLLNLYPIHLEFPPHRVSLNPGLPLVLLAAVAWGWRYGLVAGILGLGSLFTWWTWPANGWANVVISLGFTAWILWHGWCAERRLGPPRQRRWFHRLYTAELLSAVAWVVLYYTAYRWSFALNPAPWKPDAVQSMHPTVLHLIVLKSFLSNLAAVGLIDLMLNSHVIRRLLRLPTDLIERSGTILMSGGLIAALLFMAAESLVAWASFNPQGFSLIEMTFFEVGPQRSFVRVLIFILCAFGSLIATRHLRAALIAQRSLSEREQDLSITLDSIGDGVIATDGEGLVTRLNPVAEYLTGWPRSEAIGQPLERVFHIINAQTRNLRENPAGKVLEQGRVVGLANHTMLIAKDGRERQIADSAAPIRDEAGEIRGVVLVFRDVTDTYRIDERLRQAEKMESLGLLAGGIAHDFNNMLGGIMGYAELVSTQLDLGHPARRHVDGIISASERAADLTTKLLAFSRKGRAPSEAFDLHHCLSDALDLLEPGLDRRISVRRYLLADSSLVSADRSRLQNAFLNIGLNARDAMPDGGTLTVSSELVELAEDDTRLRQQGLTPGPYCSIVFADTGCGMPEEVLERVFEPFYTTKGVGKGTGLGLAAVYGTISDSHGTITISSRQGEGTSVSILLPLATEAAVQAASEGAEGAGVGGLILLAEDDASLRDIACRHLTALGYEVLTAENGLQAVAIFQEQQERIAVVILDMVMPRMNGHEAFTRIRAIDPQARVMLCSGYTAGADVDELFEQGLCGFVAKPYRRTQLARAVSEALK